MPDPDPINSNEQAAAAGGTLPIVVRRPSEVARDDGESFFSRVMRVMFGWKPGSIREDLEDVLEAGASTDTGFSPEESTLLKNILGLRERRVADVMRPRADIIAVRQDIVLGELLKVFENAGHSRLVVFRDALDDAVGMVHIRDLLGFMTRRAAEGAQTNTRRKKPFPAGLDLKAVDLSATLADAQLTREMLFVPPSMPAMDLLAKMQTSRIHLALVIDEYGGVDGIVSMEDIVEQIVGDIDDEHDDATTPDIVAQPDGSFLADARASLEDVVALIGGAFDVGEAAQEVDTLGGYLFARVGRIPVRGELVQGPAGFEIEVLDADPRRVKKLRIYPAADRPAQRERETRRLGEEAEAAVAAKTALLGEPELPVTRDASVKLSPDAPSNPPRRS